MDTKYIKLKSKIISYIFGDAAYNRYDTNLHNQNRITAEVKHTSNNKVLPNRKAFSEINYHSNHTSTIKDISHRRNKKPGKEKFRILLFLSILIFCSMTTMLLKYNALHNQEIQTGIAQEIIRFHVIANSDSNEDQSLKILVKNNLVKDLAPLMKDITSKEEARSFLSAHLEDIKNLAERIIENNGYQYNVTVSLEQTYFPLKIYGDYSFPPGYYDALRVQIGKAEGKNWWCVMFPPLCFVDETYSVVDEKSGDTLKNILTEDEYNTIVNKKTPVKIKLKIFKALKGIFN